MRRYYWYYIVIILIVLAGGLALFFWYGPDGASRIVSTSGLKISLAENLKPYLTDQDKLKLGDLEINPGPAEFGGQTGDIIVTDQEPLQDEYKSAKVWQKVLAPVVSEESGVSELSLAELRQAKLIGLPDTADLAARALGIDAVTAWEEEDNLEKIISRLKEDKDAIALLPLDQVPFVLKTAKVDGLDASDKNADLNSYPLNLEVWIGARKNSVLAANLETWPGWPSDYNRTELIAVGDMMLSRFVGTMMKRNNDCAWPYRQTHEKLSQADITFGNLESPFGVAAPYDVPSGQMVFKNDPCVAEGLTLAGFDILDLANNHFGNQQRAGMARTFEILGENGIEHYGAGNNAQEAHTAAVIEKNSVKFGFLGYNNIAPAAYEAGENTAGLAWLNLDEVKADIEKTRPRADVIVVSFHWGTEYQTRQNSEQENIAREAIDAGADMVISHHPHVTQGLEYYKGKLIAYSLGNFVFDQSWSVPTTQGLALRMTMVGNNLSSLELLPVQIINNNQPTWAAGSQASQILNRVLESSYL